MNACAKGNNKSVFFSLSLPSQYIFKNTKKVYVYFIDFFFLRNFLKHTDKLGLEVKSCPPPNFVLLISLERLND